MHAVTIGEKRGHEFERKHGGVYRSLEGGKGREDYCNYVIISKIKK